ncbi:MAG: hypothetical protein M1497_15295 [Nitrospirae bacterium]|nr:hypothetical protein [Nitrospirota bacterium]
MAASKDLTYKNYCDTVYTELTNTKARLLDLVKSIEMMGVPEKERLMSHIPHLLDIVNMIDWKLDIVVKVCPVDWQGFEGKFETTASVGVEENPEQRESVAPGDVGG